MKLCRDSCGVLFGIHVVTFAVRVRAEMIPESAFLHVCCWDLHLTGKRKVLCQKNFLAVSLHVQ